MNANLPRILTGALTLALVITLFAFRDLPMVDLPQHASQIATWLNWDDPAFRTQELELNFRTPYLLAYPIARFAAPVLGVVGALKLVVALGIVFHVAAFAHLVRRLGHDPWLSLLGVPTALGYAFCFGFVSFLVAVPLLSFAIAEALPHAERPSLRTGLVLSTILCLTLLAHGIALALAMLGVAPLLVRGGGRLALRLSPLLAPILVGGAWLLPGTSTSRIGETYWGLSWDRLRELTGMLVGIGSADGAAFCVGLLLLIGAGCLLGTPSRRPERFVPIGLTLLGFLVFPTLFRGVGPLSPRFVVLVVPGLLLAFEPRHGDARRVVVPARVAIAALAAGWVIVWTLRLPAYNRETEGVHALITSMPPGLDVRPIVFERESRAFPGVPALLHLPAYYQAQKGGTQGYSFAMYPLSVVRHRVGVAPRMGGGAEWTPEAFDWRREVATYDYFVVHSTKDRSMELFERSPDVVLEKREGDWWAYRRRQPKMASRNP